jgi:hypothetical protein
LADFFWHQAALEGSHEDERFCQRRFKKAMQIIQIKQLSSWVP